jgi:hypothetical protein
MSAAQMARNQQTRKKVGDIVSQPALVSGVGKLDCKLEGKRRPRPFLGGNPQFSGKDQVSKVTRGISCEVGWNDRRRALCDGEEIVYYSRNLNLGILAHPQMNAGNAQPSEVTFKTR